MQTKERKLMAKMNEQELVKSEMTKELHSFENERDENQKAAIFLLEDVLSYAEKIHSKAENKSSNKQDWKDLADLNENLELAKDVLKSPHDAVLKTRTANTSIKVERRVYDSEISQKIPLRKLT